MKNLKKVLSLALALVMAMSLMTTAFAADFGDAAEIDADYTEAIDVMSAIGVFEGDNHGDFNPTGKLTREQGAKIITYMLLGADVADRLTADAAPFDDVAADRWSAGAIGYCSERGILDGNGAGKFFPTQELTGYAFAKMCLTALGYDAYVQGYAGTGLKWTINVASDAVLAGIDVEGVLMGNVLTREQAAQMAYQTLTADMVRYQSKGTNIELPDGTIINSGASPAATYAQTSDYTRANTNDDKETTMQFCEKYFSDLKKADPSEVNGRMGYTWQIDNEDVSERVVTDKVLATANDGITIAEAIDKTHENFIVELDVDAADTTEYLVSYYDEGTPVGGNTDNGDLTIASYAAPDAISTAAAKVGVIVEFIDTDDNGKANAINVIEKTVATLTGDASTKEVTNLDTQVKVPGVINAFTTTNTVKTVEGYEGLVKDDVVLYYVSDGTTYIEKAAVETGVVSGVVTGDKITVNGTNYGPSGLAGVSLTGWTDFKNTYDFYLDDAGAIVKYEKVTDEETKAHAVVLDIAWVSDATGNLNAAAAFAQAELLFTDGTTKIVTVDKVGGKTIEAPTDSASDNKIPYSNADQDGDFAMTEDAFYTYTVNDKGNYELTVVATTNGLDTNNVTTGKANFDGTAGGGTNNNTGSNDTLFLVKTTAANSDPVYTAYKGINAIPNIDATSGKVIYADNGMASYVYIVANTTSGDNSDYIYIIPGANNNVQYNTVANEKGDAIAYYNVKAIVNGVEQDVKLKALNIADNDNGGAYNDPVTADTYLYKVMSISADGVIETLQAQTLATGVAVSGGTLTAGGTNAYTTDDATVFYYIDDEGAVQQLDNTNVTDDSTDGVFVIDSNSDDKAETVYILQVVSNSTVVATNGVKYTVNGAEYTVSANGTINATAGQVVVITGVTVTNEGTYTLSAASFTADGELTINLTAEDGTTTSTATVTVDFT